MTFRSKDMLRGLICHLWEKTWYIPHHGKYHSSKPGKICVRFDCIAEFEGKSINQELISGSGLSNQVVGVLTCFQQKPVTFMADVEFMHYQVMVPYNQFLWWNHQP